MLTLDGSGHHALVAIAVIAAALLVVAAYRIGGADPVRFAALGFGLAGPLLIGLLLYARSMSPFVLIGTAIAGAAAGGLLARWLGRFGPWEAMGLLIASTGVLLATPFLRERDLWVHEASANLITFGVGFAIAAGLLALGRAAGDGDPGRVGGGVVLGLGTAVLVAQPLAPIMLRSYRPLGQEEIPLTLPALGVAAALAVVASSPW